MKVINRLTNTDIDIDIIIALYTGPDVASLSHRHRPEDFEKNLPDRIYPKELVLHELNLLQHRYHFWAKFDNGDPEGECWFPVRVEK